VVLVTGAGGSIGSELCRQIARLAPARLVLVDFGENNLFTIESELRERGVPGLVGVIGDVKDARKMAALLDEHRPSILFHAAAYKHVPLMETNPEEALRNNALATRDLAALAREAGVDRFVLVSTDKAVDAQTVMGASKALCEWVVEAAAEGGSDTRFIAVRFGNVLGSSGSVIPIFRRQIAAGGPVTVTHPDMTRFFMTIPEASQLIIEGGGAGESGDIFVLDMGEPVRIVDLARDMIRLSGQEPDKDVPIVISGIRPGEKLHEVLFAADELVERTRHGRLMRARRGRVDASWLTGRLGELEALLEAGETPAAVELVLEMMRAPVRGAPAALGPPADAVRR
jgi:FlaA1/EpsC-like NDP-sugar epimerase